MKNIILFQKNRKLVHNLFLISLALKGLNSFLEILGGFVLLFINKAELNWLIKIIVQNELAEDQQDSIANYLIKTVSNFSFNIQIFTAFYLLAHGVIKIFLVWALFKKKLWAYPTAIIFFILFIIYQIYKYTHNHSPLLILLTLLDLILIFLTYIEYQLIKSKFNNALR